MKQKDIRSILEDVATAGYVSNEYSDKCDEEEEIDKALNAIRSLIQAEKKEECSTSSEEFNNRIKSWNMALDRVLEMME